MADYIYQRGHLPVTQVRVVFPRFGSCLDSPQQRGAISLMLGLMERGAAGKTHRELSGAIESLGAMLVTVLYNDHLVISLDVLNHNLSAALALLIEVIEQPNLSADEFERLQQEQISAWVAEREQSKRLCAHEVFWEALSQQDRAYFAPAGTATGLQQTAHADLINLHQRLRSPSSPATAPFIAVCSSLAEQTVSQILAPLSAALDTHSIPTALGAHTTPPALGAHTTPPALGAQGAPPAPGAASEHAAWPWDQPRPLRVLQPGLYISIVGVANTETDEIIIGRFTERETTPNWHLHQLLALIFGGDMNSRLFRVIREEYGYTYAASAWYDSSNERTPPDQLTSFCCYVLPTAEHTQQALPLLLELYQQFVSEGPTPAELSQACMALTKRYPFLVDTPQKLLYHAIRKHLYGIELDSAAEYKAKLRAAQCQDLRQVLAQTHSAAPIHIAMVGERSRLLSLADRLPNVQHVRELTWPNVEIV